MPKKGYLCFQIYPNYSPNYESMNKKRGFFKALEEGRFISNNPPSPIL